MAKKRMFAMTIVDSDAFLEMPPSAQNLYFHLNMRADDDGFIGNAKRIMRDVRATEDDLKILLAKSFLIQFDGGIYVIKHWWMHNTLMKDRYHETSYTDEKRMLSIKENKAYTLSDNSLLTDCYQNDNSDLDIDIGLDIDKDINIKEKEIHKEKEKNKYFDDNDLNDAFLEFISMRNKIKKPMTANAIKRMISKLNKLSNNDVNLSILILNQSVDHCWQDIYEYKGAFQETVIQENNEDGDWQ